jgi:poly(hydroxyalkanoate) depolymerase family esterase
MKLFFSILLFSGLVQATPKLFVPSNPKPNTALFVVLHGCLSNAEESEKSTRISEFGEKYGFFVFYPEPYLGEELSKGCFEFYTKESQQVGAGDGGKIMADVSAIMAQYDIDPNKLFVLGMSGGASLVNLLASCYPEKIRGAATHSGMGYGLASTWQESLMVAQTGPLFFKQRNQTCNPKNFKGKLFLIHGSRDVVMNPSHYSALKKDYLSDTKNETKWIPPRSGLFGYNLETFYRANVPVGQGVYVWGMNHEWSGFKSKNPIGPLGPNVSKMIVEFFLNGEN